MPNRFGVDRFVNETYPRLREHFEGLAASQSPETLFITCADSRVDPSMITHTQPGELFILRNVGNMVPAYGADSSSAAAVAYAVVVLGVKHIIVCGHSNCGAMQGLLHPESVAGIPSVAWWVEHAAAVRKRISGDTPEERWDNAIHANVSLQVELLQTHPCVVEALRQGSLTLEGWVYNIGQGKVEAFIEVSELEGGCS